MSTAMEELEDFIERDLEPEGSQTPSSFSISSPEAAEWAMRKLTKIRRKIIENREQANKHMKRIATWLDEVNGKLQVEDAYFEDLLAAYHQRLLADDPKAKTVKLPSGEIHARKQQDAWDFTDVDKFLEWADANAEDLVRVKRDVDRAAAKKALKALTDSAHPGDVVGVVDPSTGEIVPGVAVEVRGLKFSAEVTA